MDTFSQQTITEILLKEERETTGHADFNGAMMQAFELFSDSNECYKIVVVISDKDAELKELTKTIEDQNKVNKVHRIDPII